VETGGNLSFTKLTGTVQAIAVPLPRTGPHAYAANKWFHVAVTYDGQADTEANLKFYWTALDSGVCEPVLLGSGRMSADLVATVAPTFVVGNEARNFNGRTENWEGWIDEVRISDIARSPSEMAPCVEVAGAAQDPSPADKAADVPVDAVLSWTPGTAGQTHDVYLGTTFAEVDTAGRATPADRLVSRGQEDSTYDPAGTFTLGRTYYWKVVEVNEAATPTSWDGELWSFSTVAFVPIDDFESYTDELGESIFDRWIDGYDNKTVNGAIVGHEDASFAEQTIVHGGGQSMPLAYNNTAGVTNSEAVLTFPEVQDWTASGIATLTLYLYGTAGNATNVPLWVRLTDANKKSAAVTFGAGGEDVTALADPAWTEWNIPLSGFGGMNLARVQSITIGLGPGTGTGTLYVDGVLIASRLRPGVIASTTYNVNIGRDAQNTGRLYRGLIDDVRIYRGALPKAEILKLANP
jgi:hypothetical protein